MIFSKTKIDGGMVIDAEPFIDDRGAFRRHFCKEEFAQNNIVFNYNCSCVMIKNLI